MSSDHTLPIGEKPYRAEDFQITDIMKQQTQQTQQTTVPPPKLEEPGGSIPSAGAATEIMYQQPAVLAWLAVKRGPRAGKLYRLRVDGSSIGRDSHNDIILDDASISHMHAKVRLEKDEEGADLFFIHDLASANGVKVNGEQVIKRQLNNNDEIEIGRALLVFKQVTPRKEQDAKPVIDEPIQEGGEDDD
jgi:hypothetical protein